MATRDSFDSWIDFLAVDPLPEGPDSLRAADVAARAAGDRGDASEARPALEPVYVRVRRQELPLALALPLPEPSEVERLRRRPSRRRNPGWFEPGIDDLTRD